MNRIFPLISVIIPAHNAERFVEQAVRSIMNQSYTTLEILVTDDGSTDSTYEILRTLATEDSRMKVFRNERNMGIVDTLNSMIDVSQGKYIARMDADDISLPGRLEKQVEFMESHTDYVICGTNAWHIDEWNRIIGLGIIPQSNEEIQAYKNFNSPFYHPSVLVRADILKQNKYKKEFEYVEDYELWLRILSAYKGTNLSNRFLCYRILKTSISRSKGSSEKQSKLTKLLQNVSEKELRKLNGNKFLYSLIQRQNGKIFVDYFFFYYFRRLFLRGYVLWARHKIKFSPK